MKRRQFCKAGLFGAMTALPSTTWSGATLATLSSLMQGVRLDGEPMELEMAAVSELAENLDGVMYLAHQAGYDDARRLWNGMIDKRPAIVVQCASIGDVVNSVRFCNDFQLLLAVKGGGHSFPGKSSCNGGLMLDLGPMHAAELDVGSNTIRAEGGALLGHLDTATLKHRMLTTTGIVSHTGVGGFTLGGGLGRTDRLMGLAIDNLVSACIVTADGQVLEASKDENDDLFWAIRGGGGNFGVAVELVYRVHPFNPIAFGGYLRYDFGRARDLFELYAELTDYWPDEANIEPSLGVDEDGNRFAAVEITIAGDHKKAEKTLAPLKKLGPPILGELAPFEYQALQTSVDGVLGHGTLNYLKSGFVPELTAAAIDTMIDSYEGDLLPFAWFQHMGGAISRVAPDATAFAHRSVHSNFGINLVWQDPAENDANVAAVRRYYDAVAPHMTGFYTNLNEDSERKTWGNYGQNYPRLAAIKAKYDPENLFRLNANVRPQTA